ncbi:MAG: FecR family protein [Tannerellaceae bacterium]|nr:FecR family protein [Tannerellaceae bacterium]
MSIPEEIIIRTLQHTATSQELAILNKWLKEDESNIHYYFQLEEIWATKNQEHKENKYSRWKKLEADIYQLPPRNAGISFRQKLFSSFRHVAAIFLGALLISSVWFILSEKERKDPVVQHVVYNRTGVQNVLLADNSEVWINENTKISYPEKFDQEKRMITLEGNAYFTVQKDKEKPFIVRFGNAEIEVTGTEFFVETAIDEEAFVTLVSGGINLKYLGDTKNSRPVAMLPGQRACLNIVTGDIAVTEVDTYYYEAWKSGVYSFTNESFEQIAGLLSKRFDVEIAVSPSVKMKRFTGRVASHENLDTFLTRISKVYPIKYKITEKKD